MTEDYTLSPENQDGQEPAPTGSQADRRTRAIKTIYLAAALLLIFTAAQSVFNFIAEGAWQILADGGFVLAAFAIVMLSRKRFLDGRTEAASNLIPIAIFLAYAPGELFLEGVSFYNLATGLLLFVMAGLLFRPKDLQRWFVIGFIFLIFELVFALVEVFPRFDIAEIPSWPASLPVISLILLVLFLIQLLSTFRLRTIQARLLVGIITMALIPSVIIGVVTGYLGIQENIDQIGANLEAASQLKAEQINSWLTQSASEMSALLQRTEFINNATVLPFFSQENYYHQEILADLADVMENSGNFRIMYLIGPDGRVMLSTDRTMVGDDLTNSAVFNNGLVGEYITPAKVDTNTGELSIQIALPLAASSGEVEIVLVGDLEVRKLQQILGDTSNLGETGEAYLLSDSSGLLTPLRYTTARIPGQGRILLETSDLFGESFETDALQYDNYISQPVIGFHTWLPKLNSALIVEQNQSEAFESINFVISLAFVTALVTAIISIVFAVLFTRTISNPITELSETARRVSNQELQAMQPLDRVDEIGELSRSLSQMTAQMFETSQNLEKIVAERTAVLERRATYLETSAEIGRAITDIRDLDDLLTTVSHLISEKFGFYHVGVFIIDDRKEFAVLRASNSEGGWRMLAREHKLKVGEQGIVGYVTGTGKPRIQQQVAGEDSVYYDNPDLPLTKSEMALPMMSAGQILGCLDVQSMEETAFSDEDVRVLQVLADEIAVAIENANLFQQLQERIETERRIFGQITQEAWASLVQRERGRMGFRADSSGVYLSSDTNLSESEAALSSGTTVIGQANQETQSYPLSVPIRVRGGHIVAVIETQKPFSAGEWTEEEINILEGVSEQLGVALENARLFEETQMSAQRERIAADLSGKIWASTDINTILQTAVRELGTALGASEGSISLSLGEESAVVDNGNDGAGEL